MEKKRQIQLTEGPILKSLIGLALPIMASSFLGTLYNITDMAWIGILGSKAVAAVGVGGMYIWLSQGLSTLARMGGQVYVAQCFGQGKREEAAKYARAALQLTVLFAILFSLICVLFAEPLVAFFNLGDEETIRNAVSYLRIACGLIIFPYLNVVLTGLYTAQGNSRTPFLANFSGLFVNMIMDPVLILGVGFFPRLNEAGAAIATVGAQAVVTVVFVIDIIYMKDKENVLKGLKLLERTDGRYYKGIFKLGGPSAVQGTVYCGISMVLARMAAGFGAAAVAVQRVGGQIESLSWNTADGFGAAMNAFCGQNYGAGKMQRIGKGYKISAWTMMIWGSIILLIFVLFPGPVSAVFFHEKDVVKISVEYLVAIGLCEPFMCVELMTVGALSGLGRTKLCSVISITLTAARVPLALILCSFFGLNGVWWAMSVSSICKGITFYIVFRQQSVGYQER